MRVRTAVIPAAGLGTRFLPATKAVPKELLPIMDVPALQLIIDECAGAGIDHVVVVNSRTKPSIEAYFEDSPLVIAKLEQSGRGEMAERMRAIGRDVRSALPTRTTPRAWDTPLAVAAKPLATSRSPCCFPTRSWAPASCWRRCAMCCVTTGGSVVGLKSVPRDEVSAYGVVAPSTEMDADGVIGIRDMVEKPKVDDAPSNLIIIGRYVLTPDIFEHIAKPHAGCWRRTAAHRRNAGTSRQRPVPRCRSATMSSATTPATRLVGWPQ